MSYKHSPFEARDVTPPACKDKQGAKHYIGIERRKSARRACQDRRLEVRFSVDKEERRQRAGRREDDRAPKFW